MRAIPVSSSVQELQMLNTCCLNERFSESMSEQTRSGRSCGRRGTWVWFLNHNSELERQRRQQRHSQWSHCRSEDPRPDRGPYVGDLEEGLAVVVCILESSLKEGWRWKQEPSISPFGSQPCQILLDCSFCIWKSPR